MTKELESQAFKPSTKSVPALLSRGYARQRKGNAEGALADFSQAIELDPKNASAWFNRGNLRNIQRNFPDALTDFNQAITLRPDYAQAHFNEAVCRMLIGDFDRGWQKFEWGWETEELKNAKRTF